MRVGFVGWRGMVGGVLLDRMRSEGDLEGLEVHFFSTSNPGGPSPSGAASDHLEDAYDLVALSHCDTVITCQGGDYTKGVYGPLRDTGWNGCWIDAASTLRLDDSAELVLDPVNGDRVRSRLLNGCRTFVGANCTVSLLLMATVGLYRAGLVEWISTMTYQAVSGAGARSLKELAKQIRWLPLAEVDLEAASSVDLERAVTAAQRSSDFPAEEIGAPLVGSVLPWIGGAEEHGQTREEWKAGVEASKILDANPPVKIDGTCARVDALRCHSQGLCIKLTRPISLEEAASLVSDAHPWVRLVENTREATLRELTPTAVAGSLDVAVGRLRKLAMGPEYLGAFTVGDQLLWGAAEPLRRMLCILRENPA